jgi:hypothetical protein
MTIRDATSRRMLLLGAAATGLFAPGLLRAQPAPIPLGCPSRWQARQAHPPYCRPPQSHPALV